jgi:hypothetical protein
MDNSQIESLTQRMDRLQQENLAERRKPRLLTWVIGLTWAGGAMMILGGAGPNEVPEVVALTVAADSPSPKEAESTPYFKLELAGQDANVEIRGRLVHSISSIRGSETTLAIGPVVSFLLVSHEDGFDAKVKGLNGKIVVAKGTVSLAATQDRRYVRGSFLGRQQKVRVTSLDPAGEGPH